MTTKQTRPNARKEPEDVGIGSTMVRVQYFLPRKTVVAIRKMAAQKGVPYSEMARRALEQFVEANGYGE